MSRFIVAFIGVGYRATGALVPVNAEIERTNNQPPVVALKIVHRFIKVYFA